MRAKLALRRNPKGRPDAPLTLDGDGLTPRRIALDGRELAPRDYEATPESLTLRAVPPTPFALEIETLVDPTANTQLSGLYRSRLGLLHAMRGRKAFAASPIFSTAPTCSASIRPASRPTGAKRPCCSPTAIRSSAASLPDGRHFAVWHDPFPKPSYLFALVGGDLGHIERRVRHRLRARA